MRGFLDYLSSNYEFLTELALVHVSLVARAMVLAILVGTALGILCHRIPSLRPLVLNFCSTVLTIPSLALFALFIPLLGIGARPTIAALFLYALLPIVRNTMVGLSGVDAAVVESAKGMGMGAFTRLRRIELPMAWPVMLTGLRVSTQLTIGIAAIAAVIGGGGLGEEIVRGIRSLGSPFATNLVWGGTLFIVVLALLTDAAYQLIGRLTISRGTRD
ncbi:ABC transporter permease [soil metagenome]